MHVGSQLVAATPLVDAAGVALALAEESARRGAPLSLVNLGGGMGVDYSGTGVEFPLEDHATRLAARARGLAFDWVFEPGRWLTAPVGVLLAEVLWVKRRRTAGGASLCFVVLGAGMNDLIRPALYHAAHRVVPVLPRAGESLATLTALLPQRAGTARRSGARDVPARSGWECPRGVRVTPGALVVSRLLRAGTARAPGVTSRVPA